MSIKKFHFLGRRVKRRCLLMDHPVENEEHCRNCDGECCRSFPALELTWAEFETLKALGSNRLHFSLTGRHKLVIENGCEFLVKGRCAVYDFRPEVCRRFMCQMD